MRKQRLIEWIIITIIVALGLFSISLSHAAQHDHDTTQPWFCPPWLPCTRIDPRDYLLIYPDNSNIAFRSCDHCGYTERQHH